MVEAAVAAQIPLLQLREKHLNARVLYELATRAVKITRGSSTRLLINDRSDIARAAGADGVHLASGSLTADVMRDIYGSEFIIGVSTHSLEQAQAARNAGGDFVVLGPVFETESKRGFGEPLGLKKLSEAATALDEFPILAIGGVAQENVAECFRAGAAGVAAIRLFNDEERMGTIVEEIRGRFRSLR